MQKIQNNNCAVCTFIDFFVRGEEKFNNFLTKLIKIVHTTTEISHSISKI